MQSSGKIKVTDLNNLLTCMLCKGYYIDATTIVECLHSFCRTCVVNYLQTNKFCPRCDVQVHKTRPLDNIKSDQTLQDIVYKLVPNLFKNEMKKRKDFYSQPNIDVRDIPTSSEKRGDLWGCDRLIFTPDDIIHISLEYFPLSEALPLNLPTNVLSVESLCIDSSLKKESYRRYFRCPGALKIYHLKKLLCAKHNIESNKKIDLLYMHDTLKNEYTLVDLAYIYSWKRSEPLRLFFKVSQDSSSCFKIPEPTLLENEKPINIPLEMPSPCSAITLESPIPSMAAAPSSRHDSGPPSPKMAEEAKETSSEKLNCAAMPTPNSTQFQPRLVSEPKLKKARKKLKKACKKPVYNNSSPVADLQHVKMLIEQNMNKVFPANVVTRRTSKSSNVKIHNKKKKKSCQKFNTTEIFKWCHKSKCYSNKK